MNASFLLAALLLAAGPARAQGGGMINVTGTVARIDRTSIAVTSDGGAPESFRRAHEVMALRNAPATLADIRANDFVASAAMPGRDGKLHSTEPRIFSEALGGADGASVNRITIQ